MKDRCYRRDYQERHDIDWFASYNGIPIHVASNGGDIPKAIKRKNNKEMQKLLAKDELRECDVIINKAWINELLSGQEDLNIETYLHSFIEIARKGFVSIDNAFIGEEFVYKLVAYPKNRFDLYGEKELPILQNEDVENLIKNLWNN